MTYNQTISPLLTLLNSTHAQDLPKDQMINISGSKSLHFVKSGYIKRYMLTNDGSQAVQVIFGPGDIFPLTPVFMTLYDTSIYKGPETIYYQAMTPITISSVNQTKLLDCAQEDPTLYKDLLFVSSDRLASNIQRLENIALGYSHTRVAHQLLYFAEKFGEPTDDGVKIMLPLTHQDLASVLSLARETVTNSLLRLRQKQLIESHGKFIVVPDLEKLRDAAY